MTVILNVINYFWKLGYNEEKTDVYSKTYQNYYCILIDMTRELMNYGDKIQISNPKLTHFSQKNFILLEAIDRFLMKGYDPKDIHIGRNSDYDFEIENDIGDVFMAVLCMEWLEEYDVEISRLKTNSSIVNSFFEKKKDTDYLCVYSSRLKAGTIECKYTIFQRNFSSEEIKTYTKGLLEEEIQAYSPEFTRTTNKGNSSKIDFINDFEIVNNELIKYKGNSTHVVIPNCVEKLKNSVFWNCQTIEKITLPETVYSLGGDTFYNCEKLSELKIPKNVTIIGDNPFANCPKLDLINKSSYFNFVDGILYDRNKTRLIYCSIKRKSKICKIPDGVISIGKHAFYNCKNLRKIIIQPSVKIIENNPFSNLPLMRIENNSSHFVFRDGALYNKTMTTLFYFEHSSKSKHLVIPEGVRIIGRHSFYNCKTIEKITIPKSMKTIGYNPFTDCPSLTLINNSPEFLYENGTLYPKTKTELIYYSMLNPAETFIVPNTIKKIGRSAFYRCLNLKKIILSEGVVKIDRSAFAYCSNLQEVYIPSSLESIGEWAFLGCVNLKKIVLPENTLLEKQAFLNCSAEIIRVNTRGNLIEI